jgi:hypothetical protein
MPYQTWDKTLPTTGTEIVDIPLVHSNNWLALESAIATGHEGMDSASAGMHLAGKIPVLYKGTSAEILALSNVPSGAMAWDENKGAIRVFPDWKFFSEASPTSHVIAYLSVPLCSGVLPTVNVLYDTELLDSLGEFNSGVFTPKASGLFRVEATAAARPYTTVSHTNLWIHLYPRVDGSAISGDGHVSYILTSSYIPSIYEEDGTSIKLGAAPWYSISYSDTIFLSAGQQLYMQCEAYTWYIMVYGCAASYGMPSTLKITRVI